MTETIAATRLQTGTGCGVAARNSFSAPHSSASKRDRELQLIQALADTVTVALENVAMQRDLEQRVRDRAAEALAAKGKRSGRIARRADSSPPPATICVSRCRRSGRGTRSWRALPASEAGITDRIRESVAVFENILGAALLVVSDYRLSPDKNGIELVYEARRLSARQIPAVLLTGDIALTQLPAHVERMRLLHKPVDARVLLRTLDELVRIAHPERTASV